jgi:arylsulfatase A-like enzyme
MVRASLPDRKDSPVPSTNSPNLLIIHTDQQPWWMVSAYGRSPVPTPNIDRLAAEGAIFEQFFTNSAICTPSRGCFVTGRYPHCHGAYRNNLPLNADEVTLAEAARREGYHTSYVGKWHLDGTPRPGWVHPLRGMGFEDNRYMFNRGHWTKIEDSPMRGVQPTVFPYGVMGDEATYTSDYLAAKSREILSEADEPWLHMLSLPDPHDPAEIREPYASMFDPADMPLPATVSGETRHPLIGEAPFATRGWNGDVDALRRRMALFCGEIACIDDHVGRLLDQLDAAGQLDRTIVVFTSDHGDYMGEHGLTGKNGMYEGVYRLPMLVRWPGGIAPGTRVARVCSTVDFQPTILGLMGVTPSGCEQGEDLSGLLTGAAAGGSPEPMVFQHHPSHAAVGVITDRWHLVLFRDADGMLFDRQADPDETRNLVDDPSCRDTVQRLSAALITHHQHVASPSVPVCQRAD